ncbi:MAG: hypothetical protein JXA82_16525 [Sedimentisphaerales bacterium]|nr:hypothetical protein [Sedimentisphaerales bacterium]
MNIYIDNYLLAMPQVSSISPVICDGERFYPRSEYRPDHQDSWVLAWGYPPSSGKYAVSETGFFWDAMHIDTTGCYQLSSLNSADAYRIIHAYKPPCHAKYLIDAAPLPTSKYKQPKIELDWEGVVFASQNPSDRSITAVASEKKWWIFLENTCRYYGKYLLVKLHPYNKGQIALNIKRIADKYGCASGYYDHSCIRNCDHVVLFNSSYAVDCMLRGIKVKQGYPGYFYKTNAVTFCDGDITKPLGDTVDAGYRLVDFMIWKYCFSMNMSINGWKLLLQHFANSNELFPLSENMSYGQYLVNMCDILGCKYQK